MSKPATLTITARTPEDAQYRPIPGDQTVIAGVAYVIERIENDDIYVRTESVTLAWNRYLWSMEDADSTWIPAGES